MLFFVMYFFVLSSVKDLVLVSSCPCSVVAKYCFCIGIEYFRCLVVLDNAISSADSDVLVFTMSLLVGMRLTMVEVFVVGLIKN